MPIFELAQEIIFPHPSYAEENGLLAIGGDLSSERILNAYINGIFPWFSDDDPILWWSPNPRCVFYPLKMKVSKSLATVIKKNIFEVRFDTCFEKVIESCASVDRADAPGTWITEDMKNAYKKLYQEGWAHSVEVFINNNLVGGLYGLAIGKVFFGESMFHKVSNASKVALFFLIQELEKKNFELIDNQTSTNHLMSLGACELKRSDFLKKIKSACKGFTQTKF